LPGIEVVASYFHKPGVFQNGAEFLRLKFGGTDWPFAVPDDQVKMNGPIAIDIAFDEGCEAVAGALVVPTLGRVGSRVYETIERIARELFGVHLGQEEPRKAFWLTWPPFGRSSAALAISSNHSR
jgi:hypothetical protein